MAHTINWIQKPHLIYVRLEGDIFAYEVETIAEALYEQIQEVEDAEGSVHLIIEVAGAIIADKLINYSRLKFKTNSNVDWAIVVGQLRLAGMVLAIFSNLVPVNLKQITTVEEAVTFIHERDIHVSSRADVAQIVEKIAALKSEQDG